MEQIVTSLQQQLRAQQQALQQVQAVMDAQQACAGQRENVLQAQLADLSDRLNLNMGIIKKIFCHDLEPVLSNPESRMTRTNREVYTSSFLQSDHMW